MIETGRLGQQVHRHLRNEILGGRRRSGTVLREIELAKELNVSRTPVREALRQLAADGFVEIRPNHSAVVRSPDEETWRQIYEIREALEGLAIELACGRLTDDDFAQLDRAAAQSKKVDPATYREDCLRFDVLLHRTIAKRSGNAVLAQEIERYHDLVQLGRDLVGERSDAFAVADAEHVRIVETLRRNDKPAARQALVEHIRRSRDFAIRYGVFSNDETPQVRP